MDPFAQVPVRVLEDQHLSGWAKAAYGVLARFRNRKTGRCDPKIEQIARKLGCSLATAKRALRQLRRAGHIDWTSASGRSNQYALLASAEAAAAAPPTQVTGELPASSPVSYQVAHGRPATQVTGELPASSPVTRALYEPELFNQSEEPEAADPPPHKSHPTKNPTDPTPSLFEDLDRAWFVAALDYHLAEQPVLADLRAWFPAAAWSYFTRVGWRLRRNDPHYAVVWAQRLHKLGATEAEAAEAFAWEVEHKHQGTFSRPDRFERVCRRIQSQRAECQRRERAAAGDEAIADLHATWASATDEERTAATRRARALGFAESDRMFVWACAAELVKLRAEALR